MCHTWTLSNDIVLIWTFQTKLRPGPSPGPRPGPSLDPSPGLRPGRGTGWKIKALKRRWICYSSAEEEALSRYVRISSLKATSHFFLQKHGKESSTRRLAKSKKSLPDRVYIRHRNYREHAKHLFTFERILLFRCRHRKRIKIEPTSMNWRMNIDKWISCNITFSPFLDVFIIVVRFINKGARRHYVLAP